MAILIIPEELRPGMAQILKLSDSSFKELAHALALAPLAFRSEELAESVAGKANDISQDDLEETIQTLTLLYAVRDSAGVALDDFIEDVIEGVEDTELKEDLINLTPDRFKERLSVLLNIKAVAFTSKARSKQKAHERTFCTAQLLTDIRPVFGSNGDAAPVAAVPIHTLNISYHHGKVIKELFVALDSDDLDTLEDLINQAREEASQLKAILNRAEVPYPEED